MDNRTLIFLVRVGIFFLVTTTLFFVFWPGHLNAFAEQTLFYQKFISLISDFSGFDKDWLSVASLILVSFYIYGYLALTLVTANLLYPTRIQSAKSDGRDKWSLLSYVIVGRYSPKVHRNSWIAAEHRSIFDVVRAYSKSREGIGSLALDLVSVIAVSYIGYTALQVPPTYGDLRIRFIDALMVALWSYCIFSIVMWLIFILTAWLKHLSRRV